MLWYEMFYNQIRYIIRAIYTVQYRRCEGVWMFLYLYTEPDGGTIWSAGLCFC